MYRAALFFLAAVVSTQVVNSLEVVEYEAIISGKADSALKQALYNQGIVAVRGIPGYREKVVRYIDAARSFSSLDEGVKEKYGRVEGEMFLGYEKGKEKFKRDDGSWVVDDLKCSYYALVPDREENHWPEEVELKEPYQDLGNLIIEVGALVMQQVGLLKEEVQIDGVSQCGRMLAYSKTKETIHDNPFWCGAHFDHGIFTGLIPAFYFSGDTSIQEPEEAGLFVKGRGSSTFEKVVVREPEELLLFQVGEFGQLATDDAIIATEHSVKKASGSVERYTLALFFQPAEDAVIYSHSVLTEDSRYGGQAGDPCCYKDWAEASFNRYIVKEEEK